MEVRDVPHELIYTKDMVGIYLPVSFFLVVAETFYAFLLYHLHPFCRLKISSTSSCNLKETNCYS